MSDSKKTITAEQNASLAAHTNSNDNEAAPLDDEAVAAALAEGERMTKVEWQLKGMSITTKRDILEAYRRARMVYVDAGLDCPPHVRSLIALKFVQARGSEKDANARMAAAAFVEAVIEASDAGNVLAAEDVGVSVPERLSGSGKTQYDSLLVNQSQINEVARHVVQASRARGSGLERELNYERDLLRPMFAILEEFRGDDWAFDSKSHRNLVAWAGCVRGLARALGVTPADVLDRVEYKRREEANNEWFFRYPQTKRSDDNMFDDEDIPF